MEIILQVELEIARALNGEAPDSGPADRIREALEGLHASASPLHPAVSDDGMRTWFRVLAPEGADGHEVVEKLSACPGVQAVYEKPAGEAPGS